MADPNSMTTAAAAGKLLASEHADVLREAVRLMLIELMEGEVAELAGAGLYERSAERATQRNGYRRAPVGHPRGDARAGHPAPAIRQLLPKLLRTPAPQRAGLGRGRGRGLRERRLNAQGRAPRDRSSASRA